MRYSENSNIGQVIRHPFFGWKSLALIILFIKIMRLYPSGIPIKGYLMSILFEVNFQSIGCMPLLLVRYDAVSGMHYQKINVQGLTD